MKFKKIKIKTFERRQALLYLISLLDPLVRGDYIILYFHTLTENNNHPSMNWMREVYNVLEYKYKKNLKGFYIIHPTFWTKVFTFHFSCNIKYCYK